MTQHAVGMFCWCQLHTSDLERAKKFYSSLFNWSPENTEVDGETFSLVKKGGKIVGALFGPMGEQKQEPAWLSFIATDNVDKTLEKVKQAGGKILMPAMDVKDNGRTAICQDPTGGTFGLWQARKQIGSEVVNETNSMVWCELITTDTTKAGAFYRQVFGWTEERKEMPVGTYTIFSNHGEMCGGMLKATPEMHLTHPYWLTYFGVDDCDAIATKATQLGGQTKMKPTDIPEVGRFAVLTDPTKAWFAIIKMAMPPRT
jgi:predicted enzyme related to lactoylglutathione lyase